MTGSSRELISGGIAAGGFIALAAIKMPVAVSGVIALTTYACVRLLLPASNREEDEARAAARTFIQACRTETEAIRKAGKSVPPGGFRNAISKLVSVSNTLIQCFQQNPARIRVAAQLPGKLHSLREMAEGYVALLQYRQNTDAADDAIHKAEEVFPVAADKLKALLARILEDDVVKLKSDARAYEELIDFDV